MIKKQAFPEQKMNNLINEKSIQPYRAIIRQILPNSD